MNPFLRARPFAATDLGGVGHPQTPEAARMDGGGHLLYDAPLTLSRRVLPFLALNSRLSAPC